MMNLVVLDGYALNPGDLGWGGLESLGRLAASDRTPPEPTVTRSAEADAILINKIRASEEILKQLPRLRCVGVLASGCNIVDAAAARSEKRAKVELSFSTSNWFKTIQCRPPAEARMFYTLNRISRMSSSRTM